MNERDVDPTKLILRGITAVQSEEYLLGFTLLSEVYGEGLLDARDARYAEGLSHYGLCLALLQKKFKPAIDLCRKALELQFYHSRHYLNLARVYLAAGKRKKALETVEQGLKMIPEDEALARFRNELGRRAEPPIPFLSRGNPLNVALGRARHARRVREQDSTEKKRPE